MPTSPKLSFKGYNFGEALARNKSEIKAIIAVLGGFNFYTGFDWKTFLLSIGVAVFALIVKLISDAIDFYFTDVEI